MIHINRWLLFNFLLFVWHFFYVSSGSVTLALFLSETDAPNGLIIIFVTLFFTFGNGFGNYLYV